MASAPLDEFDTIPDPFAGENVDWAAILAGTPAPTQSIPPSSPEYFPEETLDESFLAELDMLDNPASTSSLVTTTNVVSTVPSSAPVSDEPPDHTTSAIQLALLFPPPPAPASPRTGTKRRREVFEGGILTSSRKSTTRTSPQSGSRRKRRRDVDGLQLILTGFEDDLTCPICYDIFVATHLLNPCGHSFCGDCCWQWVTKNKKTQCPVCRARLTTNSVIPNVTMEKLVDTHIQMLSLYGDAEWRVGGQKLIEYRGRQKKWKDGVAGRGKASTVAANPVIVEIVSEDEDEDYEEDEHDSEMENA